MGQKKNNMPLKKMRKKKKGKDSRNQQIQGRSGLGKTREAGRKRKAFERSRNQILAAKAARQADQPKEPVPVTLIDLAKKQEERVVPVKEEDDGKEEPSKTKLSKSAKARKRKREAQQAEAEPTPLFEYDLHPKKSKDKAVDFSEGSDDEDDKPAEPATSSTARPQQPRMALRPGAAVTLTGLQGAPELNGQTGECIGLDEEKGRWRVRLKSRIEKFLKPENLQAEVALWVGSPVRVVGLQQSPELNERSGTCKSWDADRGRWRVALKGGEEKLLRPLNLEAELRPGVGVCLQGIQSQPEFNGQSGLCLQFDKGKDRWRVRLQGGVEKLLKAEKLQPVASEEPLPSMGGEALSPKIKQNVEVCEKQSKLGLLLQFLKASREEERRGVRPRSLVLVLCKQAAGVQRVSTALKQAQIQCSSLRESMAKNKREKALEEFGLDGRRVAVATDRSARGLRREHLLCLVQFDFPATLKEYCSRMDLLQKEDGAYCYSFFPKTAPASLAVDLVKLLERSKAPVDPGLEALAADATKVAGERIHEESADEGASE